MGIIVTIAVTVPGYFLTTNSITQTGNNNDGIMGDGRITDIDNQGGITVVGDGNILGGQPIKPTAKIVGPKQITIDSIVRYTGDDSTDDGRIDFLWKMDGVDKSTQSFFEHHFTDLGTHTIELIVTDEDDQSNNKSLTVTVVDVKVHEIIINRNSSSTDCKDTDSCYVPPSLTIQKGEIIQWINEDTANHTITSGNPADGPNGIFDSGLQLIKSGELFEHTFENKGTFDYFCQVHPWATGTITVE